MEEDKLKGYKVFCAFFKMAGLFKEFQEYQRSQYASIKFKIDTTDPIYDFGKTQITNWLRNRKKINLEPNLFHPFVDFVREFYPQFKESSQSNLDFHDHFFIDAKKTWEVDKKKGIVNIEKMKR